MGTLVRLRISLGDRPGALAAVAGLIGDHGGNITAIDVHRSTNETVIDDLVVELPDGADVGALRAALAASGAGTLLSQQAAYAVDTVVGALNRAAQVLRSGTPDHDTELIRSVSALCSSPAVWLGYDLHAGDAGHVDADTAQAHGSYAERRTELPPDMAERLQGEAWVLRVPDPDQPAGTRTLFVARPIDNPFTATEIARIEAMISLHNVIDQIHRR